MIWTRDVEIAWVQDRKVGVGEGIGDRIGEEEDLESSMDGERRTNSSSKRRTRHLVHARQHNGMLDIEQSRQRRGDRWGCHDDDDLDRSRSLSLEGDA